MGNKTSKVDFTATPSLFFFKTKDNIGEGAFGKVRIVKHRQTKQLYALKYVDKDSLIRKRAVESTLAERDILEEVRHEYSVNMRYAFQDDEMCYFVLDLMLGGDLKLQLAHARRFPESVVRVWHAELSSVISWLHGRRIVHRDIKPDNILLDAEGHVHLTDFNVATRFDDDTPMFGFAGTMAYSAPDVFRKKGYGCAVDWWSLAVVTFELLFGVRPFNDPERSERNGVQRELVYMGKDGWLEAAKHIPSQAREWCSKPCMNILSQMLEADPRKRLGCGLRPGVQELETIRAHQWFEGLDFAALDRKELASGFIPDPEKSVDPMFAIAESMIGPTYLKARKWDPNQDTSKMSYEMRTLHERFLPYDYERPDHFVLSFNTRPTSSLSSASSHTLSDSGSGPSTPASGQSIATPSSPCNKVDPLQHSAPPPALVSQWYE